MLRLSPSTLSPSWTRLLCPSNRYPKRLSQRQSPSPFVRTRVCTHAHAIELRRVQGSVTRCAVAMPCEEEAFGRG